MTFSNTYGVILEQTRLLITLRKRQRAVELMVGCIPVSISGTVHLGGAMFSTKSAAPASMHIGRIVVRISECFPARACMDDS